MKKIKNSRNTENPYELISGVELVSRQRKKMKISINGCEYKTMPDKNNSLYVTKFSVSELPILKYEDEINLGELFKHIQSFARKCSNPLEIITLYVDAYKANKNLLKINFKTIPSCGNAMDSKFIYDELIGN